MSELEIQQLKEYKKSLRLSMQRDLYTIPQAAFRLNCSVNTFKQRYVETGLIKMVLENGKLLVPAKEISYAIEQLQTVVHKNTIKRVVHLKPKYFKSNIKVSQQCKQAFHGVIR